MTGANGVGQDRFGPFDHLANAVFNGACVLKKVAERKVHVEFPSGQVVHRPRRGLGLLGRIRSGLGLLGRIRSGLGLRRRNLPGRRLGSLGRDDDDDDDSDS